MSHTACKGFEEALLIRIPFVRPGIGGYKDALRREVHVATFDFNLTGVLIAETKEGVVFNPAVEVVDDDIAVAVVAVPPVSSLFPVGVRREITTEVAFAEFSIAPENVDFSLEVSSGG